MRKVVLAFEYLLLAVVGYPTLAFFVHIGDMLAAGTSDVPSPAATNILAIALVFVATPAALLTLIVLGIIWQRRSARVLYLQPGCMLLAAICLVNSWGMHSFMRASLLFSLGSIVTAAIGLWSGMRWRRRRSENDGTWTP